MKNIIVLAMSTLPSTQYNCPKPFDYFYSQDIVVKECISQLEPVVRMIAEKDQKDLELLVLCTPQVEQPKPFNTTIEPGEILGNISALGYFILRLARKGIIDSLENLAIDIENDKIARFTLGKERKTTFTLVRNIQDTNGEQSSVLEGTNVLVKRIRELYKTEACRLYIAANGGFRDTFLIVSGILSMLKLDDIHIDGIYSTNISAHQITDVGLSFDMFEFISGLNEFDKYGDIATIEDYFVKRMGDIVRKDALLTAMRTISEGISFCNVNLYERGLEDLFSLLDSATPQSEIMKTPEFSIFRDDIQKDYHGFMTGDFRYTDLIRRCVVKKRMVQALTFIEAKYTSDLFDSGILFFDPDEQVSFGTGRNSTDALDYIKHCIKQSTRNYIKDPILFSLQEYAKTYQCSYNRRVRIRNKIENLYGFQKKIKDLLAMVEDPAYNATSMASQLKTLGVFQTENILTLGDPSDYHMHWSSWDYKNRSFIPHGFDMHTSLSDSEQGRKYSLLASIVLGLYYILKDTRNTYNHGDQEEQPDSRKVMALIELFCDCSDVLLKHTYDKQDKPANNSRFVITQYLSKP